MRRFLRVATLAGILTVFATSLLQAQTARQPNQERRAGQDQSWFFETGLKVGETFPEMSIFDGAGKPFNTKSLKGQYTVVINGCLT
jgi:hypothetical protein